jgi:hypothetical protein
MKSRRMRLARYIALMEEINICNNLVGIPEGKIPLERHRRRWKYI